MFEYIKEIKTYIHQQHLMLLGLMLLCVWLQWFDFANSLRYDRELIIAGEWYRLFSGNLVHLNSAHLLMNIFGLAIVLFFFSTHLKPSQWLALFFLSMMFVSLGLFWTNSDILYYVGFSGVLHSLFIAGAIVEIRRYPISGWLFTISLILKLAWEQLYGAIPGSEILTNGQVIVDSHLYGAFSGMIFMLLIQKIQRNT